MGLSDVVQMQNLGGLASAASLKQLTEIVRTQLNCAGVLASQITHDQQIVLANTGMNLPARLRASMPLTHSICQHTVAMNFPLVIDDTIEHPLLKGSLAFQELGVVAYLGAPVHMRQGKAVGSICALELRHRRWSAQDVELIMLAANVADRLIIRSV